MNRPQAQVFGVTPRGETVHLLTLRGGGLTAQVLTWGAVIRDLRLEGHPCPLVLGLNSMPDYLAHSRNFGATLGRCANRIAGGRFRLEGRDFQLERNEAGGVNHLHGGRNGMSRAVWALRNLSESHVVLAITDPAGNAGYEGNVETACTIRLDDGCLTIDYLSRTDASTPVNIAHHGYFNLGMGGDVSNHRVKIAATHYLPVNADKIPQGAPQPVAGTVFDLRDGALLQDRLDRITGGYDHNFCLSRDRVGLRPVAWVAAPSLAMEVSTTEPGLQFFTAGALHCPVAGLEGKAYGPAAGLCLEAQIWPDAINQLDFPQVLLHAGQERLQQTAFRFSRL